MRYKFPKSIKVNISKSSYGFTATVEDMPGCITHGKNIQELVENVNDAVLTYFEVSRKDAGSINFLYVPRVAAKAKSPSKSKKEVGKFKKRASDFIQITSSSLLYA